MPIPRWGRRLLLAVGGAIVLAVMAAVALVLTVDVNRYRPLIAAKASEATGRTVTLGNLSLRLFPSPSVASGPLRVSDSSRYAGRDALRAERLSIRVSLLPLLQGRLVVRSIVLEKPTLTLIRDREGLWNFDDLLHRASSTPGKSETPTGREALRVAVERAVVRSGRILVYDDFVRPEMRAEADLRPVDAVISGWGSGAETRLDLSIGLGRSAVRATAQLTPANGEPLLRIRSESSSLKAADLVRLTPWLGVLSPPGLEVGGSLELEGKAEIPVGQPENLTFKGTVRLLDLSYRDSTMTRPFEKIRGTLSVDGGRAVWDGFAMRVGSSSLAGRLQVEDFLRPRIGFALTSPRVDFNEILAVFAPERVVGGGGPGRAQPAVGRATERPATPTPASPGGLLEGVSGQGTLAVKAVRFQSFDLEDVQAHVGLQRGVLGLKEMKARFYGGGLRGAAQVSLASAIPEYTLGVGLDTVDVAPLLIAYDPGLKGLLQGKLTGTLDLTAMGSEMEAILSTTRGAGSIELVNGVLTSFSVLKQLATLLEFVGGKGIGRDQTPFESLRATLRVVDRKARTEDLLLRSTDLELEGKGWVGLDATLDLDATARFSEDATRGMVEKHSGLGRLAEEGRLMVPFNLSGNLAGPKFRLNTRGQMQRARETAKERVKEKVREKMRDRILQHLGKPAAPEEPAPGEPPGEEP